MNGNNSTTGNGYEHKGEVLDILVIVKKNYLVLNPQDNYRRFK